MANETSFPILLTVLFVFCCIQQGLSIKCWVCRSDSDPKCADPFDNTTVPITDCKQEPDLEHLPGVRPTMCRKIRQKVNGVWRYFRSCAYMGEPGIEGDERFCLMRTGTYNIFMEYCTCNSKDGCNAASYNHTSIFTSIIALAISLRYGLVFIL
ncbi:UPAR/Ly6 domain-containing protein crok [Bombus flavifrons]|uniref:UPAR/Ly6 domain-containing protein crok n=1 Tax=Bombus flavifrons TaxID=103934 RepID=UPI003704A2DD